MNKNMTMKRFRGLSYCAAVLAAGAALLGAVAARADDGVVMAPPVASADQGNGSTSVFNWSDVPQNQRVPVDHATFDAGGYQIYDTAGETIIVPFQGDNLYVMKFAASDDGTMYFVNEGDAPILFVPQGGYLENATVPGARWYPFSPSFHPDQPVYVGIAPSWNDYVVMGWYPGMYCWGGYWGYHPFFGGAVFVAMPGFYFLIGGRHYYGWHHYHEYYADHRGWYRPTFYRRDYYHWAGHPSLSRPPFGSVAHPGYGGRSGFNGGGRTGGSNGFNGGRPGGATSFNGGGGGGFHGAGMGGSTGYHGFSGGSTGFHGVAPGGSTGFHGASGGGSGFGGGNRPPSGSNGYHGFSGGAPGFGGAAPGGSTGFHGASPGGSSGFHGASGGSSVFGGSSPGGSGGYHGFSGGQSGYSGGNRQPSGSSGGSSHSFGGGGGRGSQPPNGKNNDRH
ncbi:MAG: hypothetical protein ACLQVD_14695 [Capsulimonadaceae bacterium]